MTTTLIGAVVTIDHDRAFCFVRLPGRARDVFVPRRHFRVALDFTALRVGDHVSLDDIEPSDRVPDSFVGHGARRIESVAA